MKAITTIKDTAVGTLAIYNSENELIATASKQADSRYIICIFGGPAHGKIAYAADFEDLNEKSVEIARLAA